MKCLKIWALEAETTTGVILRVEGRHLLHISVLEWLFLPAPAALAKRD